MRRFLQRWGIYLVIAGLLIGYFATRLTNLTLLPIFTDEAIYIRWAQIGSRDAAWRFIPLVDGKQPMFVWFMMVALRFIKDPLFAGRFVSVLTGFFGIVGMWFLTAELFKRRWVSVTACFLYLVSPFTLMYNRMALYDSMVAMFAIWNLYLAIRLVRELRLDVALLLGLMLGAGMLNKTNGFLSLYMLPWTLLLFDWSKKKRAGRLIRWVGLAFVATVLSQGLYSILRLSPLFSMITTKDALFVHPFAEWIKHPFNFFWGNLRGLWDWMVHYLSWPIVLSVFAGAIMNHTQKRVKVFLLLWWLLPFVALALFGRVLYPRFILFMMMPLLPLAGITLVAIYKRLGRSVVSLVLFGIIVFPSVFSSYYIITNPNYAPIPFADRGQFIDDWPAGGGAAETVDYLTREAGKGKIAVYTDGTFGLLPYAIELYLVDHPNVTIHGVWPMPASPSAAMNSDAKNIPTYLVLNQIQELPDWPITLIGQWQKGVSKNTKLRLYQFTNPKKL